MNLLHITWASHVNDRWTPIEVDLDSPMCEHEAKKFSSINTEQALLWIQLQLIVA